MFSENGLFNFFLYFEIKLKRDIKENEEKHSPKLTPITCYKTKRGRRKLIVLTIAPHTDIKENFFITKEKF